MKKLEKISLKSKNYESLSNFMMKKVVGGSGADDYTCWCNNTNIGPGSSELDCAAKCVAWCKNNPC